MRDTKIMIVGHARHGKDEVANMLKSYMRFQSATEVVCKELIFKKLKEQYNYSTWKECLADKESHRVEWKHLIDLYCNDNKTKLIELVFRTSDIYCGLRNVEQLMAAKDKKLMDYIIYVDGSRRMPLEAPELFNITKEHADTVIDNNGSKFDLEYEIQKLKMLIF